MRPLLCAVLALGGLSGCTTMAYYQQLLTGQIEVLNARRPIAEVLRDPATGAELRARLRLVEDALAFAESQLALPSEGSYRDYADLGRPFVLWNVFAAPEFALQPRQWCYPLAGCFAYRGYYEFKAAKAEAERLRAQALDVYIGGVPAYSTLGWFDDPVLNTMLGWDESQLVGSLFHELAHQRLFVRNDTAFNESFASFVETRGLQQWLAARGRSDVDALRARRPQNDFRRLVQRTRERLEALYAEGGDDERLRAGKAAVFEWMRAEYRRLRDGPWMGYAGYDAWFAQDLNNASLLSIGIYRAWSGAFAVLFARSGSDWSAFHAAAARLAHLDEAARAEALGALQAQSDHAG